MWSDRNHFAIYLGEDTAAYKQSNTNTKDVGVILVSDTMGSELRGTRQCMELLADSGINVIKPMMFNKELKEIN